MTPRTEGTPRRRVGVRSRSSERQRGTTCSPNDLAAIGVSRPTTFDNIVTVALRNCQLGEGVAGPPAWHSPAALQRSSYWSIPGTQDDIERGTDVVQHEAPHHGESDKKGDQEFVKEEEEDYDLLHGLDKKKEGK